MKRIAALALAAVAAPAAAQDDFAALEGEWIVDLRLSLEDDVYTQPMTIKVADDGSVSGTFYYATIEDGRAGTAQGRTCVAFRTSDNSGSYHTSACAVDGKVIGQTWSEGRDFVLPWTATRPVSED